MQFQCIVKGVQNAFFLPFPWLQMALPRSTLSGVGDEIGPKKLIIVFLYIDLPQDCKKYKKGRQFATK